MNGDLQYDSVRPEIKEVLGSAAAMVRAKGLLRAGLLHAIAPWQNAFGTQIGGNLAGIMYSPAFAALFGLPDSVANDPGRALDLRRYPHGANRHQEESLEQPGA